MPVPTVNPPPPRGAVVFADGNFTQVWSGWFRSLYNALHGGLTVTVPLVKLTVGGTNGSLTVSNGIITGYIAPT
jgi:hypothetical protein